MRGSKAQIRIFEENKVARRLLVRSIVLYNVCTGIIYLINKEFSVWRYLFRSVPEACAVYYLYRISTPVVVSEGSTRTLVSPGVSLNSKGHVSIAFDLLFVSMLVKILSIYSSKFWLMYFFVMLSCGYEFFYKPFATLKKSAK